jgi:nonribosomal peptide synthetase DhbF
MLLSTNVPDFGRVYRPLGSGGQFEDLMSEIDEYFRHGIELTRGDVVFDVGANIGAFALHAAKRAGGGLQMFCFEPIPPVFAALQKNFQASPVLADAQPHLYPLGLTHTGAAGEALFHYFKRMPCDTTQHIEEKRQEFEAFFQVRGTELKNRLGGQRAWARGVGQFAEHFVSNFSRRPLTRYIFEKAIGLTELRCPLTTVDEVVKREGVERIDLLKVDVEGAEYDVLQGIGESTWPKIRQVVMEGHDIDGRLDKIKSDLRTHGFNFIHSEVPPLAVARGLNNFILHARRTSS